ncbi:MAG TPA: SUMF1/EgtB/PvdO family nonheme iron enzyme [Labilithrix sp.]|nr:SUMF1/EgtB/PvdO family nonheme iron enzyme [Labilithrix sp.]
MANSRALSILLCATIAACTAEDSSPPPASVAPADDAGLDPSDSGADPTTDAGDHADAHDGADAAADAPVAPGCTSGLECASGQCGAIGPAAGKCLIAPSCTGAAGTYSCGPAGNEDCCVSPPVPGGSFLRNGWATHPATVSGFRLDKYEVTVGRVRAFFNALGGNLRGHPPAAPAGGHPRIAGAGWRSSWNVRLPGSFAELDDRLGPAGCVRGGNNADGGTATWTSAPGPYEDKPITCIDWYTLFAFCAWDGARLPTDAELGYAEQGGDQQRQFAWGSGTPDFAAHHDHVVTGLLDLADDMTKQTWGPLFRTKDASGLHFVGGPEVIAPPGRKPLGNGRWGQADLTGNVLEWTLDQAVVIEGPCADCARTDWPDPPQDQVGYYPPQWPVTLPDGTLDTTGDGTRAVRGGSWDPVHALSNWTYYPYDTFRTYGSIGGRCARD